MSDNIVPTDAEIEMAMSQQAAAPPVGPDGMPLTGGGGGGGGGAGGGPGKTSLQEKLMPELERVSNF